MIVLAIISIFFYYFGHYKPTYVSCCVFLEWCNLEPKSMMYTPCIISNRTHWLYTFRWNAGGGCQSLSAQTRMADSDNVTLSEKRFLQTCYVWACLEGLLTTKLEKSNRWVFYEMFSWWWSFLDDYVFCIFHGRYCDDNELYAVHCIRCVMYVLEVSSKRW